MPTESDGAAEPGAALTGRAAIGHPHVVLDLPPTPDGASFKAWQGHLTFACHAELLDPADAPAFHASTRLYALQPFLVSEATSSHDNWLVRTGEDVARTGVDHVNISLHVEGSYTGHCGSRPFLAMPGDVSFIDFGLPFGFRTSPYRTLAVTVPRSAMPAALQQRALHGHVPDARLPATRILAQLMRDVYAALPTLTLTQGIAATRSIVEFAVVAFGEDDRAREAATPADLDLFGRAQARIEQLLGDEELSAAALADAQSVSRSALYRVFVAHDGVQAYIRERRLQRCYEIFNGDDRAGETIGSIAFSLGFRSEAHFSRTFKERFGLSPRELRAVGRRHGVDMLPPKTGGVAPDRLQRLGR